VDLLAASPQARARRSQGAARMLTVNELSAWLDVLNRDGGACALDHEFLLDAMLAAGL